MSSPRASEVGIQPSSAFHCPPRAAILPVSNPRATLPTGEHAPRPLPSPLYPTSKPAGTGVSFHEELVIPPTPGAPTPSILKRPKVEEQQPVAEQHGNQVQQRVEEREPFSPVSPTLSDSDSSDSSASSAPSSVSLSPDHFSAESATSSSAESASCSAVSCSSSCASSDDGSPAPAEPFISCPSCLVAEGSPSYAAIEARHRPVYPSLRLLWNQLRQTTLWDRLFTHCTGRDLLCKIVQHSCGLLEALIELWTALARRLARYAIFRFLFRRRPQAPKSFAALPNVAPSLGDVLSASRVVIAPGANPVLLPSPPDAWVPPFEAPCPSSGRNVVLHVLRHASYTMYRARQILRFGRWIYDIPDVRDSFLELLHGTTEEKSLDEQEEDELWVEHERMRVIRAPSRRASIDFMAGKLAPLGTRDPNLVGRGTFLFPVSSLAQRNALLAGLAGAGGKGGRRSKARMCRSFSAGALSDTTTSELSRTCTNCSSSGTSREGFEGFDRHAPLLSPPCSPECVNSKAFGFSSSSSADGDAEEEDGESSGEEDDDDDEDDSMTLLEWTVGVVDFANSLMGLIIDASDDVDFLSSLGLLPEWVGETAGTLSSWLWLVSGGIDVAMCCYKLHEYKQEMRESIREQVEELREREKKRILSIGANQAEQLECAKACVTDGASPYCSLHSHECSIATALPASLPAPRRLNATVSAHDCELSLCTRECDVDCFHVEWLRLWRYVGEMGLSVCGALELCNIESRTAQAILEASGLVSGLATLTKRAATHARSSKEKQKRKHKLIESQPQHEQQLLYH